jgi:hypothetical protein
MYSRVLLRQASPLRNTQVAVKDTCGRSSTSRNILTESKPQLMVTFALCRSPAACPCAVSAFLLWPRRVPAAALNWSRVSDVSNPDQTRARAAGDDWMCLSLGALNLRGGLPRLPWAISCTLCWICGAHAGPLQGIHPLSEADSSSALDGFASTKRSFQVERGMDVASHSPHRQTVRPR